MNNTKLDSSNYTYENNVLTVDSVGGNILVEYVEKAYLAVLSQNTYFKEDAYREKIKNIEFVNYIDTSIKHLATYDLSENQDRSIIGWIDKNYNLYIGSEWDIYSKDLSSAFYNMTAVESIKFDNLNTSEATTMHSMFRNMSSLKSLDLSSFNTSSATNMSYMFYDCKALTNIKFNWTKFNTVNVTNMDFMFCNCFALTELDLSGLDTTALTTTKSMFGDDTKLKKLRLDKAEFESVTAYTNMFYGVPSDISIEINSTGANFISTNFSSLADNITIVTLP